MLSLKKSLLFFPFAAILICFLQGCFPEDKSKRPSPPATTSETLANGNTIKIGYSSPSLKGRSIGKEIARFDTIWQTGDNEATTFEITKAAKIEGKALPAGKYSLYTIPGKKTWTIIFNKIWDQWGVEYKKSEDALRVQVAPEKFSDYMERMKFIIDRDGRVLLFWGDTVVAFKVE